MAELAEHPILSLYNWSPRQSGVAIRDDLVGALRGLWEQRVGTRKRLRTNASAFSTGAEEFDSQAANEGRAISVLVNSFERDPKLREACIRLHGYECGVCRQQLSDRYGEVARYLIHVHHLRPLSEIGKRHSVNPDTDLVPVCPNCHAVIHLRKPPFTVQEVQAFLKGRSSGKAMPSSRRR
ncbi:MAG: HNH endonuclease [Alphaproteobacteria bacterium]